MIVAVKVRDVQHAANSDHSVVTSARGLKDDRAKSYVPRTSSAHFWRTRLWYNSRTCDSCEEERGRGEREGLGTIGALLEVGEVEDIIVTIAWW